MKISLENLVKTTKKSPRFKEFETVKIFKNSPFPVPAVDGVA